MSSYQDVVQGNLPQAAWALVEGSGNDHAPYVGTIHLTSSGTRLYQQTGPFPASLSMHFGGDGGLVATNPLIYLPPVTLEAWLKLDATSTAVNRILMYYGNTNTNGFGAFIGAGSAQLLVLHGGVAVGNTGFNWPDTNWHLLQLVHTGGGTDSVFFDGRRLVETSIAAAVTPTAPLAFMMNNSNAEWVTGSIAFPALYPFNLTGSQLYASFLGATDPNSALSLTLTGGAPTGLSTSALLAEILAAVRKTW